jgi:hypothetical protein
MDHIKMMEQIEGKVEDSTAPMPSQKNSESVSEFRKGLGSSIFEIFDMQHFFEELELEGREPLS